MKRSRLRLAFALLAVLFFVAVAIPTVTLKVGDEYKRIRNLNPADLNTSFVTNDFDFRPSLDFQSGQIVTFDVDLSAVAPGDRLDHLARIRNIIYTRFQRAGLSEFELDSIHNQETEEFLLVLRNAETMDTGLLGLLTRSGQVSAWIDDTTVNREEATDEQLNDPFFGRLQVGISNEDFESASVISDSRIYLFSPEAPSNFGIRLIYREESAPQFVSAAQQSLGSSPILYAIDREPIAFQTPGQQYDYLNPGRTSMLVTLGADTYASNAVIASVMSTPKLDFPVTIAESQTLLPRYGSVTIQVLQAGSLVGFAVIAVLFFVFSRKHLVFAVSSAAVMAVTIIALMKMFNLTLSLATLSGFLAGYGILLFFLVSVLQSLKQAAGGGYTKSELETVYTELQAGLRNTTIVAIFTILVSQTYGLVSITHFGNGAGFALVGGLVSVLIYVRAVLPHIYLNSGKRS